jgi:uncharacterized protein YceH (UPF0502 family)
MAVTLNDIERRVVGALLEKSLAQPQYYPMTLSALVAACNQKSNRNPVMDLDEEAVWNTLEVLRAGGLVTRLLPGGSSRVERFKHEAREFFGWEKPQRAIMAELLLRGPQTVGELRGRCGRLYPFDNVDAVQGVLATLAESDPPLITRLPRAAGQSAERFAHRLYPEDELAALTGSAAEAAPPPKAHAAEPGPTPPPDANIAAQIAELQAAVATLQARVAHLEGHLGVTPES